MAYIISGLFDTIEQGAAQAIQSAASGLETAVGVPPGAAPAPGTVAAVAPGAVPYGAAPAGAMVPAGAMMGPPAGAMVSPPLQQSFLDKIQALPTTYKLAAVAVLGVAGYMYYQKKGHHMGGGMF